MPIRKRFYWLRRFWSFVLLLSIAITLSIALLHARESKAQFTPCFSSGNLSWPVPYATGLGNNYMQIQIDGILCHEGVDILEPPGTEVVAIEGGDFVLEGGSGENYWMVIESESKPGEGFLYQHFDPQFDFELFEPVAAGALLGTVADYSEMAVDFDHLHLGRVRGYEYTGSEYVPISDALSTWSWGSPAANPLGLLEKPDDSEVPVFLSDDPYLPSGQGCDPADSDDQDWPFWFRDDQDVASESSVPLYHCPNALPKVAMDIVCKISDFTKSGATLNISPCCARVTVQPEADGDPYENAIAFDGEQNYDVTYMSFLHDGVLDSTGMYANPRTLYLVVTNDPFEDSSWTPTAAGNYVVTIAIQDAAGNSAQRSMTVTVQ